MPSPKCVLVVDDDTVIRTLVADALVDDGYAVVTASNGADALVKLTTLQPDAIVLDLMMPVMDGRALLAACREQTRLAQIPVLVLSAAHDLGAVAPQLGARACLAKPFDLEVQLAVIEHLVQADEAAPPVGLSAAGGRHQVEVPGSAAPPRAVT